MHRCVSLWSLSLLLLLVGFAAAECPNGCSGNGAYMQKDMCNCYKNYQGNDCADRTYAQYGWLDPRELTAAPSWDVRVLQPKRKAARSAFLYGVLEQGYLRPLHGLCTCFDGYEGVGCQRTVCPGKCSGRGTCESIRELGAKAEGTLFGIEHPGGSAVYDLWDGNATHGCRCDPWFRGADCSKRTCKVGVDPLYLSVGTPIYETFVIHAWADHVGYTYPTTASTMPWIRLRVFDYHGESYITSKITILDDSVAGDKLKNGAAVQDALKNILNLTFRDITCEGVADSTNGVDLKDFLSVRPATSATAADQLGMSVICQYIDNSGKHRIPEVVDFAFYGATAKKAMVVTTGEQGQNDEWLTKQATITGPTLTQAAAASPQLGVTTLTVTGTVADNLPASGNAALPALIKVGSNIVMAASWTTQAIVLAFPLTKTVGSSELIFLPPAFTDPAATPLVASALVITATVPISVSLNVGDTTLTFAASSGLATGDLIFFHNQFFMCNKSLIMRRHRLQQPSGVWRSTNRLEVIRQLVVQP